MFVQPMRRDDLGIGAALLATGRHIAAETQAQYPGCGSGPEVNAHQRVRTEATAGFLLSLADDGVRKIFACFQMAGGLIEYNAPVNLFLDHEEPAVLLNDSGDRDFGLDQDQRTGGQLVQNALDDP